MAQNQIFALVLLLSATLSTFLFIFALNKRPMPGAIALTLFGASQVWWSLTYAIYWLQLKGEPNLFWLDMTYFGVVTSPAIFFAFTVIFTQRATWLFPRHAFLLAIMPTLTMLILFTDPWHGLFYGGARSATSSLIYSGGIWFWINAIYSYLLIIVSLYFLAIAYLQADPLKKKQIGILFLGGLCPVLGTLVSFFKINPIPNLDLTPILFTLTCLIYSYGFFWYRLLDILPIARNKVVENMTEGLLVLEKGNRILDINRSARELLNLPHLEARGQDASLILPFWDHISKAMGNAQQEKIIQKIHTVPDRFIELQITPLYEKETDLIGNVIVIRDQTERIHFENELKQANLDLQQKLGEIAILQEKLREQAIRDSLTGLFNRHFLDEALNIEI